MRIPPALVEATSQLIESVPEQALDRLLPLLDREAIDDWQAFKHEAQRSMPSQTDLRARVGGFVDTWQREAPALPPLQVLGAIQMAAHTISRERRRQVLELVGTGPRSALPLRQTAQALRQVIDEARQTLLIVSFAVYDIPEIVAALTQAIARGVRITFIVETIDRNTANPFDRLMALGSHVRQRIRVCEWPLARRERNEQGHYGVLHVKCAVADERALFLSSANLTQYALTLNIEMGILVHGGPLPQQVQHHFQNLIEKQILVAAEPSHPNR
ncbi:MAG TPA: DISARM system phospholipase D-like protein DrmC [Herpetosiphonaceae bacterium]|nr:DISARM system phospholipase D-like protein DrmC [Herpetosiphonaceae bacterium]